MTEKRPSYSDKEIIETDSGVASPFFDVPVDDLIIVEEDLSDDDTRDEDESTPTVPGDRLPPMEAPSRFKIFEQTVRFTMDGRQVVDVIAGWNTIQNADGYEVRITKVD
jgi:hypothetical protein